MDRYRSAALALVAGVAALSVAACSAGVISSGPAASSPASTSSPAASHTAASHTATASAASAAGATVRVGGRIGSFPIPPGATVVENASDDKGIVVLLGSVTPAQVSRFYTSALPRYGYKITENSMASLNNGSGAAIEFTGHGYMGTIGAESGLATSGSSHGPDSNLVGITLDPA